MHNRLMDYLLSALGKLTFHVFTMNSNVDIRNFIYLAIRCVVFLNTVIGTLFESRN